MSYTSKDDLCKNESCNRLLITAQEHDMGVCERCVNEVQDAIERLGELGMVSVTAGGVKYNMEWEQ